MKYAELCCKTNFSFLEGASHAEELATRAAEAGCHALAITDRNTLAGVVRAHQAAKSAGVKLLIGAEITPLDGEPIVLLAMNIQGYRNLSQLITRGRRNAVKGDCRLGMDDIAEYAGDLLAVISDVQRLRFRAPRSALCAKPQAADIFPNRVYLTAAVHRGPCDDADLERIAQQSRQCRVPMVATNRVHYHTRKRRALHDVLTAIKHHTTVANLGALRFSNGEHYLKSPRQMARLFARYPEAIERTIEVADRCSFSLDELRYEYPAELCPAGKTATEHLTDLTWAGARERYPTGTPEHVRDLLQRELTLIAELRYEAFFLTCWDLVVFARSRGILCQGRGSAANSAVCFCLGITSVDPIRGDLLFERFISKERNEPPDIDIDFEHERREEVFQYIYAKYGRERAGIVAEVITYQPRSSVRDVGKALGLSLDAVGRLAKAIDWHADASTIPDRIVEAGLAPDAPSVKQLVELSSELIGFPRHLSQHVGGFVITGRPLSEIVPIGNAAMPDRTFIEWDKDDIDALGILKVDCLSLGMLTAIRKCFDLIGPSHPCLAPRLGRAGAAPLAHGEAAPLAQGEAAPLAQGERLNDKLTLAAIPSEDPAVYDMICDADTIGVFQIESRAQMSMLPRLKPRTFYDLVIEVAIVRPGPIQGGMVHPYLRRRSGVEPVTYAHPTIEQVLKKTLGVPLFQEQVMRLAIVAAGFTPGEADQLRRSMAAWKRKGTINKYRDKFRAGLLANGFPPEFAEQIYEQIKGFGEYGFPESHAASFALLAYVSAWLKRWYPAAFTASIINSLPMGFYEPAQLIYDARNHGVAIRPIDVNHSEWDCTLEKPHHERSDWWGSDAAHPLTPGPSPEGRGEEIRLGFRLIKGLSATIAERIVAARKDAPFRSILDISRRAQVSKALLARLAAADAFGSLGLDRRAALWKALAIGEDLPLFACLEDDETEAPNLPPLSAGQQVSADYHATGLSLKAHPLSLIRADLDQLNVVPAAKLVELRDKASVRIAGLVLVRQRPPTANGTVFLSLEDETGLLNVIVWKRTWERFRKIAKDAVALYIEGKIERADKVIHVCPTHIDDLSRALQGIASRSRDFR
jgi:error-prone DNA polymerase